jgi:flagellin-specific chaperone FliS
LAALALLSLTLFAVIPVSCLAAAEQASSHKATTDSLFALLLKANSTVTYVFSWLKAENIEAPEASLAGYNQAIALAENARSLYEAGNYTQASSMVVKALQKLKETLSTIYGNTTLGQTSSDTIFERTIALNGSIIRLHDQLRQTESLLNVNSTANLNTTSLKADVAAAKSLLQNASNSLSQKNLEAAASYIGNAQSLVERLTQSLNAWAAELKSPRLETYISETETRLTEIRAAATSVLTPASITALDNAEKNLTLAKTCLQQQQLAQTVTALVNVKVSEEQAVQALKPPATASNMTAANATSITGTTAVSPRVTGSTAVQKP